MSLTDHHDPTVPREALIGAAVLLAFVMALTGATSLGLIPQSANPETARAAADVQPAQSRSLRFTDQRDGSVAITDAQSGAVVSTIAFGEGGFVRATMRRLAKARAAAGIGAAPPFTLTRWNNGALSLTDPQTGESAEIHGFGADHSRAFADMLNDPAA